MKTIRSLVASLTVLAAGLFFTPVAVAAPEIQVLWNTTEIVDGDSTPSVADHTFFGVQTVGAGSITQTFTIKNTSTTVFDVLSLTGTPVVSIGGGNSEDFVVSVLPTAALLGGGVTTFQVTWTPTFGGIHNATLTIPNNDSNENPYNFAIQATAQLKLTYEAGPNGSISGTTPQIVYSGNSGTAVTAVPATNYHFVNWSDGSTANPRTDTPVTANITVKASFAINTYTLSYTAGANGSLTGNTSQTVNHGANGTAVTATPLAGYHFVNWSDSSTANPRVDTNVTASRSVTANFALSHYSLDYTTGTEVPLSAAGFTATGWTVAFTLNYAPQPGTRLMVVNNTGLGFIQGSFSNVAQGQVVTLNYAGVAYPFVANYYGGTGNDLVLVWQETRSMAWGYNNRGQLGDTSNSQRPVPVAVNRSGVLAGKTVFALAAGDQHSLALCSDGTLGSWGNNFPGQLGFGNTISESLVPVAVNRSGVLAGKTVVAISAGGDHCLVLCSDGTVAAWGRNSNGQLGSNSIDSAYVPVVVDRSGVLAGKTVVAVSAGTSHSLALCSDGTLAAWGKNYSGQLGNNSHTDSHVPVVVTVSTALEGKTVVAVSAGKQHSLAACSDGTVVAWGDNSGGQLGNNSTTESLVAVPVFSIGALNGKTVVAVSASEFNSLALCSDGALRSWGYNPEGQLGDNNAPNYSLVPVAVNQTGLLADKTVVAIAAGGNHGMARCSDGTLAVWGKNANGQLGNNSYSFSSVPVSPALTGVLGSGRVAGIAAGSGHSLVFVATTPDIAVAQTSALADGGPAVSFGDMGLGGSAPRTFTITNPASVALTSLSVTKDGPNAADFTLSALSGTSIPEGSGSVTFTVSFSPGAVGSRAASLHITSNATGAKNPFDIALSGSGQYVLTYTAGAGGSLTGTTPQSVNPGANGTAVTAVPTTGYHFVNWSDASTANPRTDTNVTANLSVTANFAINTYTLNYAAGANGTLTGSTSQTVNYGADGTAVTAVPDANYHFVNWSGSSTLNPRTDKNVKENRSVTANFAINTYTLSYTAGAGGSLTGTTSQTINAGTNGTAVTAVPTNGYHFVNWSDASTANPRSESNVTANLSVTANFAIGTYTLTYTAGANGSLTGTTSQTASHGTDGTAVTAVPDANYHFVNWSDASTANPRTDTNVTANRSVTANFAINTYTLSYTPGANGTLTGTTPQTINHGANGTAVTAVPTPGYHFVNWSDASTANPRTDTNVTADLGVTANFLANAPPVLFTMAPTSGPIEGGTNVTLSGENLLGASSVTFGGTAATIVANTPTSLTVTSPSHLGAAVTVVVTTPGGIASSTPVTFHYTCTLSYTAGANGSLTGNTFQTLDYGTNATAVTAVPAANYRFINWSDASTANPRTDTNVTANLSVTANFSSSDYTGIYADGTEVPVNSQGFTATGKTVNFTLNYAPLPGTQLMVVKNSRQDFIQGTFDNLPNGSAVTLDYGGITYQFVAWYYGGDGNDLVLLWRDTRPAAWGRNADGQLGDNSTTNPRTAPGAVIQSGVLAGKTVVALSAGGSHSLALCSDGTLAAWGSNADGQLGDNSNTPSTVPVAVTQSGVLAGKTVVALSASISHSLVLCSDGTVAAWGNNASGQLGDNSTTPSNVPVAVTHSGVLAGKTVVAIASGRFHSLALCSDGTLAAWGGNSNSQLGDNSTTLRTAPVAVTQSGVLAGKTVVAITGGSSHNLALCSDGTLAAWGYNTDGELGDNSTIPSNVPVDVTQSGVLAGKTVVALSAGAYHNLALCSDGSLAAWGRNTDGQLGDNSNLQRNVPVAVTQSGVLAGKTIVALAASIAHSQALCSDGSLAAWGKNSDGQLGDNSTSPSNVPVDVTQSGVLAGHPIVKLAGEATMAFHSLALYAINTYTLSYAAGANGTLAGTTPQTVNYGANGTTVTAVPASNYHFVSWSDGITTNPRTDTNVAADVNATANFEIGGYTLSYAAAANGALTGSTTQTVNHGGNGTAVTAVPATGYHFVNWSDSSTANPRTDTNVTADLSVAAIFAIDTYTLTYTADANGSLSGTTPQTVDHGADGTAVTAIPASDYRFTQWSDGSTDNPRTETNVTTDQSVTAYFVLTVLSFTSTPTDVTITDCDSNASGALAIPVTINGLPVTRIGDYAFHSCERLTSITIPASVTSIGNYAFVNCYGLTSMTIPEGVTRIGNSLFFGCYQLASITIPSSVTSIGSYAFAVCKLTSFTIPAGVTSIGVYAFQYCSSLTSITIPATVTSLGAGAFEDCSSLIQISVAGDSYGAGTHGTLSGPTPLPGSPGATGAAVTAVPNANYHFVNWSDANTDNPRTDTNETANLSVTANFAIGGYTLTYAADANGSITGTTPQTVNHGTSGTAVTAVANAGYHFVNWSDANTANPRTDTNVTTTLSVTANFVVDAPALSGISPANGPITGGTSVTISGNNLLDASSVTFGGVEATIDSFSPTSLTVTGPAHVAGLVAVVVTTPGGSSNPALFTYDAPLETWRQAWFGPAATNTGDAANNADPYHTGIPNLLVFAFLGPDEDPATARISQLPQATTAGGTFTYQFTEPSGVSGITYGAEWSATLGNDWQPVPDTGTAPEHVFSMPVDGSRKFLRLTVN